VRIFASYHACVKWASLATVPWSGNLGPNDCITIPKVANYDDAAGGRTVFRQDVFALLGAHWPLLRSLEERTTWRELR
jgi:hypothetical protein